jgi:hypothetical protein
VPPVHGALDASFMLFGLAVSGYGVQRLADRDIWRDQTTWDQMEQRGLSRA